MRITLSNHAKDGFAVKIRGVRAGSCLEVGDEAVVLAELVADVREPSPAAVATGAPGAFARRGGTVLPGRSR